METFSDYILGETDYNKKVQIMFMLDKREEVGFDTSVIFKTDLAKQFIEFYDIEVDKNLVLTACLLSIFKDNTEHLKELGFVNEFCEIYEGHNRCDIQDNEKLKESDILELVDQFGDILLDKPKDSLFRIQDAMYLLEYKNLKGRNNRYLEEFKKFIEEIGKDF